MNKGMKEAEELASGIVEGLQGEEEREVVLCPPFTALQRVGEICLGSPILLGAQNLFYEAKGAYTGEISASQLVDLGCRYVIVGHSERRQYFGETDQAINKKLKAAISAGLFPILCVGEKEEEREAGKEKEIVGHQLREGLRGISEEEAKDIVIAYEPVWAIGTGKTALPSDAQGMHLFIRELLREIYNSRLAQDTRIQYGGSVKPDNIDELMAEPDIDGALVGGASLEVDSFICIVKLRTPL